jgi:hypothetical protein
MFASYWKVDLLGEPIVGAKAVAIPLNLPPLQLIREDPPIPRGLRITRTGSGGSSLLPGNDYSSWQHWWSKWGRAFGLLAIAALLLFLAFLLGRKCWQKEALQFAVIIDGGSTGTCVDVYAWAHSHRDPLPVM